MDRGCATGTLHRLHLPGSWEEGAPLNQPSVVLSIHLGLEKTRSEPWCLYKAPLLSKSSRGQVRESRGWTVSPPTPLPSQCGEVAGGWVPGGVKLRPRVPAANYRAPVTGCPTHLTLFGRRGAMPWGLPKIKAGRMAD